ncbi:MAG: histidine--tRNA ligase, partial [Clostridia bacterium]|nr:histidine--tRNA ligase [Clostridia bacterium]
MKVEPKTLPGFMELLPENQILFNKIKDTIRKNYEKFGFLPLDTPVLESSEVLLAKAGGETEKQIYSFEKGDNKLCMRFDLTVPLAKYVAKNYNNLNFPFKRYQIDKVYRGERPQKGRFREFYQCDIDVIGKEKLSLKYDAEVPSVMYNIFKDLAIGDFTIFISNRKLLLGLLISLGLEELKADVLRMIDKLDKITEQDFISTLAENYSIPTEKIDKILEFVSIKGTTDEQLTALKNLDISNEIFATGVAELEEVVKYMRIFGINDENFAINLKIARGLDYYTGTVYETFLKGYESIGSVCSGGRYDNLAEYYTDAKLPGVGMSIGLTRLFYQLNEIGILRNGEKTFSKA